MSPTRLVVRWSLTLVALVLASLALLLLALRLALGLADGLTPRLEALLSARFGAEVSIAELDTRLAGFDPALSLDTLTIASRDRRLTLLEVESGRLRLDTLATLRAGVPVVEDARLSGVTLHLYQTPEGGWHWPDPAELPPELQPSGEFDLERLDFWVGVLLRQRAWADEVRVVLHGRERRVTLESPRLLMTGDERHAHLEGEIRLEGDPEAAMQAALEVLPGPGGFRDFSAALQAEMRLDSLISLVEVLGRNEPLRLDESSGRARLWGRWHRGSLADARLELGIARLAVSHADENGERHAIELSEVMGRGQWLRRDEGWEAWFEGDAESPEATEPEALETPWGPALPHRWQLAGDADGWWLNTSGFDVGSLAAWRHRVPLPEALGRVVDTLDPRGQVTGFRLGHRHGEWLARAALSGVEVSPWEQAPGGGPLDIWVEARDLTGRVHFVGGEGASLHFPELFEAPMALEHAAGEVVWAYDGPRTLVTGRDLRVGWNGAEVQGGFGLAVGGGQRGGFGLTLGFTEVDAVETPLVEWLPVGILGDELRDWLGGVAGRVSEGSLRLHAPLGGAAAIPPSFGLELAIEQGRLAFDPAWPALTEVRGQLSLQDTHLQARVEHAESLGVTARRGEVRLVDERLEVEGELEASAEALRRYLLAMPVEGIEAVEAWQGEGRAEGQLRLALPLGEPGGLELDIETQARLSRLVYRPLELAFSDLAGPLAWRQRGEEGGLEGRIEGRLLGGPVRAEIDTLAGGLDLAGSAEAGSLLDWGGVAGLRESASGRFPWQGRLAIGEEGVDLGLDSNLEGLILDLPSPLGKAATERRPLRLDMDLTEGRLDGRLGDDLRLRWRDLPGEGPGQGQVWLGRAPAAGWPAGEGWWVDAYQPRLDPAAWAEALGGLGGQASGGGGTAGLREVRLATDCLESDGHCIGSFAAEARPQAGGGWRAALDGSLLAGQLDYRPALADALDIGLTRLSLDGLTPEPAGVGSLFDEIATPPEPTPLPGWVAELPDGRLRIAEIERGGQRLGPLTARWRATPERLTVAPLGLTLGQITARGELVWEAAGDADSLTRARLDLDGRDLGTALEALGQAAAIRSAETRVKSQLAWPGAPWQFALERSRGSVEAELRDGRFVNLASTPARLVGLLNLDNLVRRLRLDFSDVTGQGTAFDRVSGAATLYGGILETRGPVTVDGPATRFTLEGRVDLARRELDQRLGVTVPISRNLPLAAVLAGAPVVGGALFIADRLFGDALDRVTRIHYRVRGPWTAPQISVESAE
ncbi:YhdP family protein [Halomonas mongoliensis]|uniref:YhdP family protein n=1 Tax=Halomonas mongoliensis TaxID=321265 RepID=A0ABU1GHU1_9GAMM|nr:YhdP family protein [Halomonas mongoliensis]MDR5891577.1 YhdP family protein [Halomonas mongoliensis]